MSAIIEGLLKRYEGGQISRRDLVASLSAMVMARPRPGAAQSSDPPIKVRGFNHVTLTVTDIPRSVEFYQSLFGLRVQSRQGTGVNLSVGSGPQFVGVYGGPKAEPRINHFCLGVEDFDAGRVAETLDQRGVKSRVRMRSDAIPELYLTAPDGISVQLQDVSYCGGSGPLGNQCP